jgi:K+/H+ antiporter YhaU regulatory subunit KhtT
MVGILLVALTQPFLPRCTGSLILLTALLVLGIADLISGLGGPVSVEIGPEDYASGRSLAELDLRNATDATVLVIVRPEESIILPIGREMLRAGDVLALAGTEDGVSKAVELLRSRPADQFQG